ncbi:hypothetical protein PTKIN_Ptkin04bG0086000 [Pterospermum kingtungense]
MRSLSGELILLCDLWPKFKDGNFSLEEGVQYVPQENSIGKKTASTTGTQCGAPHAFGVKRSQTTIDRRVYTSTRCTLAASTSDVDHYSGPADKDEHLILVLLRGLSGEDMKMATLFK